MASKKNKPKADPAALTLRVWVIEQRDARIGKWRAYEIREDRYPEWQMATSCSNLSARYHGTEFRYRAATLTFDDDGGKCMIY